MDALCLWPGGLSNEFIQYEDSMNSRKKGDFRGSAGKVFL